MFQPCEKWRHSDHTGDARCEGEPEATCRNHFLLSRLHTLGRDHSNQRRTMYEAGREEPPEPLPTRQISKDIFLGTSVINREELTDYTHGSRKEP